MADGAGASSLHNMDSGIWSALSELARQTTGVSERLGAVREGLEDRVTHKELMQAVSEWRKENTVRLDHMEGKFDQAVNKVESLLDRAVDRIKDNLGGLTNESVERAMSNREARDAKAIAAVEGREAEILRIARNAQWTGRGGVGVGLIGVLYAIWQGMGGGFG
jgi:hypothetical protein